MATPGRMNLTITFAYLVSLLALCMIKRELDEQQINVKEAKALPNRKQSSCIIQVGLPYPQL